MYIVTIDGNYLHHPEIKDYYLLDAVVKREVNKSSSFSFTIYASNPMYNSIQKLKSNIEVYDDGELIFRGRPLNDTTGIYKDCTIQCEGDLAFLNDSVMPPYEYAGTVKGLLQLYISNHNNNVDSERRFTVGTVTAHDANDYVVRSNIDYTKTWDEVSSKTFGSSLSGYLILRREGNTNYIDYLSDSPYKTSQEITLRTNLLDFEQSVKGEDIVTVLIPLGAKLEDAEGNQTDERLTISSVNGGKDYIENTAAISKYGRIVGFQVFDDVTVASNLLSKGQTSLDSLINFGVSMTIKAIDLNMVDKTIPKLRFFEYVRIKSEPHNVDSEMLIKKQTINLTDPSVNSITVGVDVSSFTDKQLANDRVIQKINSDYITNAQLGKVVSPILIQVSEIIQQADLIKIAVSEIKQEMPDENLIVGLNGEFDIRGWTFEDEGYLTFGDRTRFFEGMKWNSTFIPVTVKSLSGIGLKFVSPGSALSPFARVFPDVKHSYRVKRISGSQRFTVSLLEYNSSNTLINTTNYEMNENNSIEEFTQELDSLTTSVRLKFTTYDRNPLVLSDAMFNRGEPKNWSPSVGNVEEYSKSGIKVLSDEMSLFSQITDSLEQSVTDVSVKLSAAERELLLRVAYNDIISAINMSPEQISILANRIRLEGIVTANDYFKILLDGSAEMKNALVKGTIEAIAGKIAGFNIEGNNLKGSGVIISPRTVEIGGMTLQSYSGSGIGGEIIGNWMDFKNRSGTVFTIQINGKSIIQESSGSVNIFDVETIGPPINSTGGSVGFANARYGTIYLQNQPNVSSDIRYKSNIQDIDNDLLDAFEEVMPKLFNTEFDNNLHFGYIAQDVERALYKYCLKKYGYEFANEKVKQFAVLSKSESYLSLLYGELTVIKDAYYNREVERLKVQNQAFQSELQAIKQFIGMGGNNA